MNKEFTGLILKDVLFIKIPHMSFKIFLYRVNLVSVFLLIINSSCFAQFKNKIRIENSFVINEINDTISFIKESNNDEYNFETISALDFQNKRASISSKYDTIGFSNTKFNHMFRIDITELVKPLTISQCAFYQGFKIGRLSTTQLISIDRSSFFSKFKFSQYGLYYDSSDCIFSITNNVFHDDVSFNKAIANTIYMYDNYFNKNVKIKANIYSDLHLMGNKYYDDFFIDVDFNNDNIENYCLFANEYYATKSIISVGKVGCCTFEDIVSDYLLKFYPPYPSNHFVLTINNSTFNLLKIFGNKVNVSRINKSKVTDSCSFEGDIELDSVVFNNLNNLDKTNSINIQNSDIKKLISNDKPINEISIKNSEIGVLNLSKSHIITKKAIFESVKFIEKIDFSSIILSKGVSFINCTLPDTLLFNNITHLKWVIDLTEFKKESEEKICLINLTKTNIDNIRIRYDNFKLLFDNDLPYEEKTYVYEKLLHRFQQNGFNQSYKNLDIEYQEFKYLHRPQSKIIKSYSVIVNFIDKNWWNYGYNKEKIIVNTLLLMLLFMVINLFFFKELNENVYEIRNIYKASNVANNRWKFMYTLYYTVLIFFGIKMNIDNLKFQKKGGVIYIFIQYSIGIVCLAYLANFILT